MAKNPTAHLRAQSRAANRAADKREADNAEASFLYMQERGAFDDIDPDRKFARYQGDLRWHVNGHDVRASVESLPWNAEAPKRIVSFTVSYTHAAEGRFTKPRSFRSMSKFIETKPAWIESREIPVPHWDYDGIDPLVAREPWERAMAERALDWAQTCREWDAQSKARAISNDAGLREMNDHMEIRGYYDGSDDLPLAA